MYMYFQISHVIYFPVLNLIKKLLSQYFDLARQHESHINKIDKQKIFTFKYRSAITFL